ncbi:hypothetical protein SynMITS9220M01_054 [Synechococcus phage SynMITS9220M01]|nr:hypothetical protein SynMITS9220M01_054 [Synechococcus phage SynMITS9220M01]
MSVTAEVKTAPRIEFCQEFADRIVQGEFDCSELEDLSSIMKLVFLQIREQDIIEHIRSIADKVDEVNGDLKNTDPVLLWEEAGEDGEDIGGDGNHTRQGLSQSKHADKIKTRRVPKAIWKSLGITIEEMVMIGALLNKENEKVKASNSVGTLIKQLKEWKELGHDFNSAYSHEALKALGKDTKKQRDTVIRKAKEDYLINQASADGKKVKQYGQGATDAANEELKKKVERLRDSKTMVISGSTGVTKTLEWNVIGEIIDQEVNAGKHKIALVLYHNSFENKENWEGDYGSTFMKRLNSYLSMLQPVEVMLEDGGIVKYNYKAEVYFMDFLESDGRDSIKTN